MMLTCAAAEPSCHDSKLGSLPPPSQRHEQLSGSLEESMYEVVFDIQRGRRDRAQDRLRELLGQVDLSRAPSQLKYHIFGSALAHHLSAAVVEEANLYLSDFEVPQIHLFNLLARHVPVVYLSTRCANRILAELASGQEQATFVDIGIGTGRQMIALLELLASLEECPRRVRIIGIEPSKPSLELAAQGIRDAAARLDLDVEFRPIHNFVEDLTPQGWAALRELARGGIINASFALHHVRDVDGHDVRDLVLRRLRWLEPRGVVLAEPNVDHCQRDLVRRFHACWRHFGTVFALIDRLGISQQDKDALKVGFFGREILDILGDHEERRSERHEETASWLERLRRAGFSWHTAALANHELRDDLVQAAVAEGHVALSFEGEVVASVLCARPDPTVDLTSSDFETSQCTQAGLDRRAS